MNSPACSSRLMQIIRSRTLGIAVMVALTSIFALVNVSASAETPTTSEIQPALPTPFPGMTPSVPSVPSSAVEAGSWHLESPLQSPLPRGGMGFVYDTDRDVIVAIGGSDLSTSFAETWEYDGDNWAKRSLTQSPSGRNRPSIAYDPQRHVTVLFGGSTPGDSVFYNETWEYDGNNWAKRTPLTPPSPRNGAAMAYDPIRGVMLLFGGYRYQGNMVFFDETWEYNGAQWIQRFPSSRPDPRETAGMAYDSSRGVMVLFGGGRSAGSTVFSDTWEWDGSNWVKRSLAVSPPARWAHAIVFDQHRNRTVLFGGLTGTTAAFNDTWEFDGTTWSQVATPTAPPVRWDHGMAYDATANETILFGGAYYAGGFVLRNDTWTYSVAQPLPERPVVLLPGIGGSQLYGNRNPGCSGSGVDLWLNLPELLANPWDTHLTRLGLKADGFSPANSCDSITAWGVLGKLELPPIDFYETLEINLADYRYNVYPCPYDWRRFLDGKTAEGTTDPYGALSDVVDQCVEAARAGSNTQVDIVAHSLGGLVARAYVLSSAQRAAKIHTIVSLGTPYLGAPGALLPFRYGDTGMAVDPVLNNDRIIELSRNAPSFYQTLPSQAFFQVYGATAPYFWSKPIDSSVYTGYPTFALMQGFLAVNFNANLVSAAEGFHNSGIDDWRLKPLGVDYYVFVGKGVATKRWIHEETVQPWGSGPRLDYDFTPQAEGGDGTVLLHSADLGGPSSSLADGATICYYQGVDHGQLTKDPIVFTDVDKALRGEDLGTARCFQGGSQTLAGPSLELTSTSTDSRQLTWEGAGNVHVWDEQGRHTGPASNGVIENNIPLVTYLQAEDKTFVTLPPVSSYIFTVQMAGSTPATARVLSIAPAETPEQAVTQTVLFQNLPSAQGALATFAYNPLADPSTYRVKVDLDGDGQTDITQGPTDILDGTQSSDRIAPRSTITVDGQQDALGFYIGQVTVTLEAVDAESGVSRIEYSLDGGKSGLPYVGPFVVSAENVPVLYARAFDRAGNSEYPWAGKRLRPYGTWIPIIPR
jgi:hypothetical protein